MARVRELKKVNTALNKRRRAKKSLIQIKELLTVEDTSDILIKRDTYVLLKEKKRSRGDYIRCNAAGLRYYSNYGKIRYNSRTC